MSAIDKTANKLIFENYICVSSYEGRIELISLHQDVIVEFLVVSQRLQITYGGVSPTSDITLKPTIGANK